MAEYEAKEVNYIMLLPKGFPECFSWEVRYFSQPRINSMKHLVETIRSICRPKKDFKITWTYYEIYGDARIPLESDEELKAAQDYMMKRCKCKKKEYCDGCGNIELLIEYLPSGWCKCFGC